MHELTAAFAVNCSATRAIQPVTMQANVTHLIGSTDPTAEFNGEFKQLQSRYSNWSTNRADADCCCFSCWGKVTSCSQCSAFMLCRTSYATTAYPSLFQKAVTAAPACRAVISLSVAQVETFGRLF
eukprot:1138884-Pelagomonas_calceolata.AAC.8